MSHKLGRREFLQKSAVGSIALAPAIQYTSGALVSGKGVPPSDQITVGVVGIGRRVQGVMKQFSKEPEVRIAALCDVYEPHLSLAKKEYPEAKGYSDFRKILERKDIDALLFGTPDHWHALNTIMACQAGKDVYVEKPISVTINEGRKMVEAARKYQKVVQAGTQQRSGLHFQQAAQVVQEGRLGRITAVRTWNLSNQSPEGIGNPPDSAPPAGLDWDAWLGPAPKVPFNANRFGVNPDRFSTFRYFWDYAGGMMTDWGVHLLDIVQLAMKVDAPLAISMSGGKLGLNDNRETPDTLIATYEYPGFVCTYEHRACNGRTVNGHNYGIEFYGTEGSLFVDRSGYEIVPEMTGRGEDAKERMESAAVNRNGDSTQAHIRNFLDCMKSRALPIADIEICHRSTSTCLLANISYRVGRKLSWDAVAEKVKGDEKANSFLKREYRKPWVLKV